MTTCIYSNPPHPDNPSGGQCAQCFDTLVMQCFLNYPRKKISEEGIKRLKACLKEDMLNKRRVE
jgi:hypothetical protein